MRWIGVVFVAVLVLVLGGCGAEDPPPPRPTSAATTPANPDATLPTPPARADEFSPTGANRFVHHYVSLLDYASKTGDVEELSRLSDPGCEGCRDYIDHFAETYESGGYLKGRDWSGGEVTMRFAPEEGAESYATTVLKISAGINRGAAEDPEKQVATSRDKVTFAMRFNGHWIMTQFGLGEIG